MTGKRLVLNLTFREIQVSQMVKKASTSDLTHDIM